MEIYSNEYYNPQTLELYLEKNLLFEYLKVLDIPVLEEAKSLIECDDLTANRIVILKAIELELKSKYLQDKSKHAKMHFNINTPKRYSKKTLLYFLYINRLTDFLTTLADEELERCHNIACDDIFEDECKILDAVKQEEEYRKQNNQDNTIIKK